MKRINYCNLILLASLFLKGSLVLSQPLANQNSLMVTQEIRYSVKDASEVFLVWGINNWQSQEENLRPPGTFTKDGLLYTPMKQVDGMFSTKFSVKPNTQLDYVFWITKGPRNSSTDIWDINNVPKKDYHTITLNDSVTLIQSNIKVRSREPLTLLDFSWQLLLSFTGLILAFIVIKKYRFKEIQNKPSARTIIIASAIILVFGLFIIRSSILGISWDLYLHPLEFAPQLLWAGLYDFLYVAALTLLFLAFLFLFQNSPRIKSAIVYFFISLGLISLVSGILNIRIVQMLGKPFNYRWLYYSDFLHSADAKAAMSSNISLAYIVNIIIVCIAAIIGAILIISVIELLNHKYRLQKVLLTSLVFLNLGYLILAQKGIHEYKWNYNKLANPVFSFVESVNPFKQDPELFTMELADSLKMVKTSGSIVSDRFKGLPNKIKNVIVLVLESTPAEYIEPYGSKFKTSPELEKNISNSIVFENIYAHVPSTNKSMVCLLGSIYPWISYTSITQEHPDINISTISSELKKHGYRTAFFNSGDNHFQRGGEFLALRKFDTIKDCRNLNCTQKFGMNEKEFDPLDGTNDECTGQELMKWVKNEPDKPFFTMMWTYQTHYPYYFLGSEKQFDTSDPILNRYLNAVKHSDLVLGRIIEELKTNNLFESTLIVVVGDHGEAFGRHDQTTHSSKIYEENLHIPCVFINPKFEKERSDAIGGSIDIAPTIMNVLGLPASDQWHGKSLFTGKKNDRAYFFAPWADYLFGYREGDRKYIYNATTGDTEIYDLNTDPQEAKNIATDLPEQVESCHQRLGAWVQYQNKFMEEAINAKGNNERGN
ncbi:MAG: sulfatase-like hydrolase/transferase [Bacteroidota bacterium]